MSSFKKSLSGGFMTNFPSLNDQDIKLAESLKKNPKLSLTPTPNSEKINTLQLNSSRNNTYTPVVDTSRQWKTLLPSPLSRQESSPKSILSNSAQPSWKIDPNIYDALIHNGYPKLALTLQRESGQPWDSIKKLSSPIVMEQIRNLYYIAKTKNINCQKLMDFCLAIASQQNLGKFSINSEYNQTTEFFGKLMILIDYDPKGTFEYIDTNALEKSISQINRLADKFLDMIFDTLKGVEIVHDTFSIQDGKQVFVAKLSLAIARILITHGGILNIGLINFIIKKWLPDGKEKLAYEKHISYVLKSLSTSSQLRSMLDSIEVPSSPAAPANHLIRICLELPSNAIITNSEPKTAALMALLSHLRQGPVGSCFATYIAIEMLSSRLERCLSDFRQMLRDSKLIRTINYSKVEFPFLMKISSNDINKPIQILKSGHLFNRPLIHIGNSPGIQIACMSIGITSPQELISQAIQALTPLAKPENFPITIRSLLYQIVIQALKTNLKHNKEGVSVLFERAIMAFEAQTHNPLLRVWENAIANTAEARDCSLLKQSIVNSIIIPISEKSKTLIQDQKSSHPLLTQLIKVLNQRIHLQYDPNIRCSEISTDGHSSDGAFVLFDRKTYTNPLFWKQINSPESFQEFIISTVQEAYLSPSIMPFNKRTVNYEALIQFIKSNQFLRFSLEEYNQENRLKSDLAAHLGALAHVPWLDKTGDDPKEVLHIYLETKTKEFTEFTSTPSNTYELLSDFIKFGKNIQSLSFIKSADKNTEFLRLPLLIQGIHACSLIINHPSYQKAWASNIKADNWIQEKMIAPGKAISSSIITKETREKIAEFFKNKIINIKHAIFYKDFGLIKDPISIQDFRNEVLRISALKTTPEYLDIEKLTQGLDAYLYTEALPEASKKSLHELTIHFADTNWERGINETYFSFIFNPGTANVELWEVLENDKEIFPVSKEKWIHGQSWSCIPEPYNA